MAKHQTLAVLIPFALVAWRKKNNFRKNYGDAPQTNATRNSLATHEWVADNSIPAYDIDDADLVAEMEDRQAKWDSLRSATTPESATVLKVFELLFVKDGRLIKPEYSGNAGFRRAGIFLDAMVQRFTEANKAKVEFSMSGLIPVRPVKYATRIEQIKDQQLENELQTVGAKRMEDLEKLEVTKALFDEGCLESEVRTLYSSSTAQKSYGICLVDRNFPTLNIYPRFLITDATNPERIPWGPIRAEDVRKFNSRFYAQQKRAEGLPLSKDENGLEPVTPEQVDSFFRDKAKGVGDGNAAKIMKKGDIEGNSKSIKLKLAATAFKSVLNDTKSNLRPYLEHADAINTGTDLIDQGKGTTYSVIMEGVAKEIDLFETIARLVKAGRVEEVKKAVSALLTPAVEVPAPPITGRPGKVATK
jgi:hypothetical protein